LINKEVKCSKKNTSNGFEFKKGMYDVPFPYHGKYKFTKHFLGNNNIPSIARDMLIPPKELSSFLAFAYLGDRHRVATIQ